MGQTEKIAISLSREVLSGIEKLRKETGESRSAIVRRGIQKLLQEKESAARIQSYLEGYRRQPETGAEIEAATLAATELLAREPWE